MVDTLCAFGMFFVKSARGRLLIPLRYLDESVWTARIAAIGACRMSIELALVSARARLTSFGVDADGAFDASRQTLRFAVGRAGGR